MTKRYEIPIYRVQLVRDGSMADRERVSDPKSAAQVIKDYIGATDREHMVVVLLDTKNQIIGINTVSVGTLNSSIIHPREVFKPAYLCNAGGVILGHNHPSGDTTPSPEDIEVTKRIVEAGEILGVQVLDHIIVDTWDGRAHCSFREKGLI